MTIITTQRLIIRHFKEEDAAALFDYLSSPRTPCFKDEKLHSLAEAEVDVAKRASDPTQFAVCLNEADTLIGHFQGSEITRSGTRAAHPAKSGRHHAAQLRKVKMAPNHSMWVKGKNGKGECRGWAIPSPCRLS